MQTQLPIWQLQTRILEVLSKGNRLVLVAPTGSGKTTQVPQMLLDSGSIEQSTGSPAPPFKKIVVLQPRRVAARTVAARVAWERNVLLGGEVGYQIRFEDRTSLGTKICYITEGILLRWLQDDPLLADIGAILFDEFHERNLLSDVALALARQLQETKRPDLKLLVMSATLEAEPVAEYLSYDGGHGKERCSILVSEGRMYPVDVEFLDKPDERSASDQAADAVEQIIKAGEPGDILVFMPGMAEINATIRAIGAGHLGERVALIPLHGDLPPEQQDEAFTPNSLRKIVVATNVAETSVTIDGIRHVVDSGLARISRYDAERGITTLLIEPISRSSAEQRKGRAGRTAPGTCHHLWTESSQLNRPERNTPEIQRSDLAEVVLLLHSLGIRKAKEFNWLDKPDPQAVERAEQLLITLGALKVAPVGGDALALESDITPIGKQMLRLPMHPRYSRMMVQAMKEGCVKPAALCAALVSGRDLLVRLSRDEKHIAEARELFEASDQSDFFTLMRAYQFACKNNFDTERCRRYGVHANIARQVDQTYRQLLEIAEQRGIFHGESAPESSDKTKKAGSDDGILRSILSGFIDQLCLRRSMGTLECEMAEGRQATLMRESVVQNASLFVAATVREVASRSSENMTLAGLATAVKLPWIEEMFPEQLNTQVEHLFDRAHKRVAAVKLIRFRDLVIHHEHQREVDPAESGLALAKAYAKQWFELPLLNHDLQQLCARINLVSAAFPELEIPPVDENAKIHLLGRAFAGLTLVKEAQAQPLKDAFGSHLKPEQRDWVETLAPVHLTWPDGKKLKLLYPAETFDEDEQLNSPEVQVKIHECFWLKEHPHLGEGKIPVKLWLLTPDGKRLEATFNWPAFKSISYPKIKSNLQKKFPGVGWL